MIISMLLVSMGAPAASASVPATHAADGAAALEARLSASDAATGNWFGAAVALDGDTLVVGAPFNDNPEVGFGTGAAYVFVRSGTAWSQQARLVASDAAVGDQFGTAVALDGDTLVVGAPFSDGDGRQDSGAVYIFARSGTTWSERGKIVAQDAAAGDRFGASVMIDGDRLAVGAPFAGGGAGAVYVIERGDGSWSEQTRVASDTTSQGDQFGATIALDGDMLLAGAPFHDTGAGIDAGVAYVFAYHNGWHEQAALAPDDADALDQFGAAVALDGDRLVVGAPQHDTPAGADAGAAYIFERGGSDWFQQARAVASDGAADDGFGMTIALAGDVLAVGVRLKNAPAGVAAGSTYLFARSGGGWSEQRQLAADDAAAGDQFGAAVALNGNTLVVGAPLANLAGKGADAGAAYVWRLAFTTTSLASSPNPSSAGQPVTLEATVAPVPPATSMPTGSVTFYAGLANMGAALLDANGHARLVTPDLPTGSTPLVAVYSGDDNLFASTSPVVLQTVGATVQFSMARMQVAEGAGNATVRVSLSGPITQSVTVDYATGDGSATAGSDYVATSGTLTIAAGQRSASFEVPIVDDSAIEDSETALLTLGNPHGAALGSPATAMLVILDNDRTPGFRAFLPMSMISGQPDLVITQLSLTPDKRTFAAGEPVIITVVVENRGNAVAPPFWVDLYINPASPPTVNNLWNNLCTLSPCYGIAWAVENGLAPGERVTLTSTPASYAAPYTRWPGSFAAGTTDVYALADSWNPGVSTGAVLESDETNNRAELHGLAVRGSRHAQRSIASASVAPRPAQPER